jgi:hypothetical protein
MPDNPHHRASLHHFMYRSSYYWPEEADEKLIFQLAAIASGHHRSRHLDRPWRHRHEGRHRA